MVRLKKVAVMSESSTEQVEAGVAQQDEARAQEERIRLKRQRTRSLALAWGLALLAILFFVVTIVRLGPMVANRPL